MGVLSLEGTSRSFNDDTEQRRTRCDELSVNVTLTCGYVFGFVSCFWLPRAFWSDGRAFHCSLLLPLEAELRLFRESFTVDGAFWAFKGKPI